MKDERKKEFRMPASAEQSGKGKKGAPVKEPPYRDFPDDPVRPPYG